MQEMIEESPKELSAALFTLERNLPPITKSEGINWIQGLPFILLHLVPLLAFVTGVNFRSVVLCIVLYTVRLLAITVGYHRYFAHRTYKLNRVAQLIVAIVGASAAQKGPLWWAAHHRVHHRYADTERDIHSPIRGFWWSHVGWILDNRFKKTEIELIPDFAKYPEIRFVDKFQGIFPILLGVMCFLIAGWPGVIIGFALSTVLEWHATFLINSASHMWGPRRYNTPDTSRNNFLFAILTFGEGWHNNHHNYPPSAKLGETWWEIDMGWYLLKALNKLSMVKDLRMPNPKVLAQRRI